VPGDTDDASDPCRFFISPTPDLDNGRSHWALPDSAYEPITAMTFPPQGPGPGDQPSANPDPSAPDGAGSLAGPTSDQPAQPAPPAEWLAPGWSSPNPATPDAGSPAGAQWGQPAPSSTGQSGPWGQPAAAATSWQSPQGWQPIPVQAASPKRDRLPAVRNVFALILAIAIAFAAGAAIGAPAAGGGLAGSNLPQTSASFPPEFAVYEQAWKILHDNYVDPSALDPTALTYGSISGLMSAVGDTDHTRFLSPTDLANENSSLSGQVVGIGAEMSTVNGNPVIQSVIPGSPAEKAGLVGGDTVLSVDGVSTSGQSVDTVVSKIRGDAGTTVVLSIQHAGASSPVTISIVRAKVEVPSVSWAMIPGTKIADIRIEQFATNATKELTDQAAAARKAGATAMILDLRGNPGGYVGEAVGVASQFLKDGNVYENQDKDGKITPVAVTPGGTITDLPLVVLVDNGTASSAEIVSGAIQDAKRGELIGQKTFGTGTVLTQFPLSDGSALLIGTVEWLTRDGRQIWKQGIVPDITLDSNPKGTIVVPTDLSKMTTAQLNASGDLQLLKGISTLSAK
jgi:carboxyl-terminal processing protease